MKKNLITPIIFYDDKGQPLNKEQNLDHEKKCDLASGNCAPESGVHPENQFTDGGVNTSKNGELGMNQAAENKGAIQAQEASASAQIANQQTGGYGVPQYYGAAQQMSPVEIWGRPADYLSPVHLSQLAKDTIEMQIKADMTERMKRLSEKAVIEREKRARMRKADRVDLFLNEFGQLCEYIHNENKDDDVMRILITASHLKLKHFGCDDQGKLPDVYELRWDGENRVVFSLSGKDEEEKVFRKVLRTIPIGFSPRRADTKDAAARVIAYLMDTMATEKIPRCFGMVRIKDEASGTSRWIRVTDKKNYLMLLQEVRV